MIWIHRQLLRLKIYANFITWTKSYMMPGFGSIPLYTVAAFFFREISKESLVNKASSLAYSFLLAIFPGIIFLFSLIPFVPIKGFQDQLLGLIHLVLPTNAYLAFESTLKDIIKNQSPGLLSLGFLSAIFFATNGVKNLMRAFNKSSLSIENRSWIKQRIVALVLTFVICISVITCISAMALGEIAIKFIKTELDLKDRYMYYVIQLTRWALLLVLYFITISILYRYGPAHAKKWKLFSPGSFLATLLAFITSWAFSYYINNFGAYNKLYGSIGTLIVVMIWLYLNSLILLIGFELNASVDVSKRTIRVTKPKSNFFRK